MPSNFAKTMRMVNNAAAVRSYAGEFNSIFGKFVPPPMKRFDETGFYESLITLMHNNLGWKNLILSIGPNHIAASARITVQRMTEEERRDMRDAALKQFRVQSVSVLLRHLEEADRHFYLDMHLHANMDLVDFMDSPQGKRHEELYWVLNDLAEFMTRFEVLLKELSR